MLFRSKRLFISELPGLLLVVVAVMLVLHLLVLVLMRLLLLLVHLLLLLLQLLLLLWLQSLAIISSNMSSYMSPRPITGITRGAMQLPSAVCSWHRIAVRIPKRTARAGIRAKGVSSRALCTS